MNISGYDLVTAVLSNVTTLRLSVAKVNENKFGECSLTRGRLEVLLEVLAEL